MMSKTTLSERFAKTALVRSVVARNIAANFIVIGWLSLLSILAIPVYIKLLGVSEWGIVAACASLQLLSNFIDAGFSQIVPRWVAREVSNRQTLHSYVTIFRRLYLALGLLAFILLQVGAGYLAQSWFQVASDRTDALELAIRIVAFQMLFQFVNNLHIGIWHGMQKQVLASLSAGGFGTLKHMAAMAVLFIGSAEAWLYASAFAIVAMLEVLTNAWLLQRIMKGTYLPNGSHQVSMKQFSKEVSLLSGGVLIGLMVSQLDRLILSRSVSLEDFGVYTVVATLALAFLQLQVPFTRAYFPLLVNDIVTNGRVSKKHLKKLLISTLLSTTFPALVACFMAPMLLQLWIGDPKVIETGTKPLQLILLAVAINSLYGCIYQIIVASGQSHRVLHFNLTALVVTIIVAWNTSPSLGLMLGGIIWITNTVTQLALGLFWFYGNASKTAKH